MHRIGKLLLLILTAMLIVFAISGCDNLESLRRPVPDAQVKWVSGDPNMYYVWDEEKGYHGELIAGEATWQIWIGYRSSIMNVLLYDLETGTITSSLFRGSCKFEKDKITVSVTQDNADIFGGDLPTIVFEKQDRDEDGRQGDGSSVLMKPQKGDDIPSNDEMSE